jgi:xylan 1,4-beta-xylosidase
MVTGDGTPALKWGSTNMYDEDADGNPIYDWTISDRILDAYLSNGVKPYVQIGFMPKALSTHPEPYQHRWQPGDPYDDIFTGWAYPPRDYDAWRQLVHRWVKHAVDRYGAAETGHWYWEVWNEANMGYWQGTPAEFRMLHDYAIDGVRTALPTARVGGPDSAGPGGQWMRDFLDHCLSGTNHATGEVGTPIDFISFHAKGAPSVVDGHVRMGLKDHLKDMNDGFEIVASYPALRPKPIIIGESDPDGCAACSASVYPQNAYRNTALYASYTAACFARAHELAERHGVNLEGALTWAFEFEDQPLFAGFRVLSTGGINLPVLNVFRMLGMMKGHRLTVTSTSEVPLDTILTVGVRGALSDVSAMAAVDNDTLTVLSWNYHDDDLAGPDAAITFEIKNLSTAQGSVQVSEYRIDSTHSNAYTAWQQMGAPAAPTEQQTDDLVRAGHLETLGRPQRVAVHGGAATVGTRLPRQGVSLLVVSLA